MSDVHSVGGYVTAGSLFALGLASWQVLIALLVGIVIVNLLCNPVAKPSQQGGVPYPVVCRSSLRRPRREHPRRHPRPAPAWRPTPTPTSTASPACPCSAGAASCCCGCCRRACSGAAWGSIRKFIDFCGPAVYVVMFILCGYLLWKSGRQVRLSLGGEKQGNTLVVMLGAIALVVSYFSGPMLNFGDFARYGKSFEAVKKGNFLGLPINFLMFSILVVVTAAATVPVFGELLTDPVETVARIDNVTVTAIVLGALTFSTATIGINIVANFMSRHMVPTILPDAP